MIKLSHFLLIGMPLLLATTLNGQTTANLHYKYAEHRDYLSLADGGIVLVIGAYDENVIYSISPEGKMNWEYVIESDNKFHTYFTTVASPDGKYVYTVYSGKPAFAWPVTEFVQIDKAGNSRVYKYEELHEEKEKFFKSVAYVNTDKQEFELDAYYCDNNYFYRIEEQAKNDKLVSEDIVLEINRLTHDKLEYEKQLVTVPAVSSPELAEYKFTRFEVVGSDQNGVYLSRKAMDKKSNTMVFQVIGLNSKLEVTTSSILSFSLPEENELLFHAQSSTLNNVWNQGTVVLVNEAKFTTELHGNIYYDAGDEAFYAYGVAKKNNIFLRKFDKSGKQLLKLDRELTEYGYIYRGIDKVAHLAKNINGQLSLSIWEGGELVNIVFTPEGEVIENAFYNGEEIAKFPEREHPVFPGKYMKPEAMKFYSGLKSRLQGRKYFQYFVGPNVHYVASINLNDRTLDLLFLK